MARERCEKSAALLTHYGTNHIIQALLFIFVEKINANLHYYFIRLATTKKP
jgi:hypothetical protein